MVIGTKLRSLREEKGLSQGDIEKSTGLLRCYISRIENGHTIPSLETLERFASALDVPLYRLFYSGEGEAPTPNLLPRKSLDELAAQPGEAGEEARFLLQFKNVVARLGDPDREVVLTLAKKLATR
ncbi:MAG TPA: helix-turn-helix transcriptional regulator [Terriglobia bacterium]|nr:helix-turn-helix transcriptional regulator [Terriglobia bacterium]